MKNFVQQGETLDLTLAADVVAGMPVIQGDIVAIAVVSGKSGDTIPCKTTGVYDLPYGVAAAVSVGAKVYWASAGNVTGTSSGNVLMGHAVKAAASGDATIRLKLVPYA